MSSAENQTVLNALAWSIVRLMHGLQGGRAHLALVELLRRESELFEAGAFAGDEVPGRQRLPVASARAGWGIEGSVGEAAQPLQPSASCLQA